MGHCILDLAAQDMQYGLVPPTPQVGQLQKQTQNIASERSWRDVCSKSEYFSYRGRDCHFFFFFLSSPAWTSLSSISSVWTRVYYSQPCFLVTKEHSYCQFMKASLLYSHFLNNMTLGLRETRTHMAPL